MTEYTVKVIADTLTDIWSANCAQRSVQALAALGIDSNRLHEFRQTARGQSIDEVWYMGTLNEMRDREIRKNKKRKKEGA